MSLLRAVHAALAGDPELTAIVGARVFEHVPARARMPYIVLGAVVSRPWDTASDRGQLDDLTVHVWSRASRRGEANEAVARVRAALNFENLVPLVATNTMMDLVSVVAGETRTERLPERDLVHATMRFRFTREERS